MTTLRLGTRRSKLAMTQSGHVADALRAEGHDVEIVEIVTEGDTSRASLASMGGHGVFASALREALLAGEIDIAVHSLKDLPTTPNEGLEVGAVTARVDPRDVVVFRPGAGPDLEALPEGARVGTSSLRRRAQLLAARPDLVVDDLRGNLDTRLARVAEGDYDAAILAAAGIIRLDREDAIGQRLDPRYWLPAVGQGALGIAIRAGDQETRGLVAPLDDPEARSATTAERAFLNELEGGCQVPIGALATVAGERLRLDGMVASLDGTTVLRTATEGAAQDADVLGRQLAAELLDRGAGEVLAAVRAASPFRDASAP